MPSPSSGRGTFPFQKIFQRGKGNCRRWKGFEAFSGPPEIAVGRVPDPRHEKPIFMHKLFHGKLIIAIFTEENALSIKLSILLV